MAPSLRAGGILLAYGALLLLLAPAEINGDGVGYLRQIPQHTLAPGHLAYLPLLRLLAHVWPHGALLDLVLPARLLSLACALTSLVLLYDSAHRLHGQRQHGMLAVALLGLSHCFIRSSVEVEVYAISTLLATGALWALTRSRRSLRWALPAGLLAGTAVLLHLTLTLLALPLILLLARSECSARRGRPPREGPRRLALPRAALAGIGAMALVIVLALGASLAHRGLPAGEVWGWLRSADHGIPDPHGWLAPLVALWGIARSLVHVPYPYESSMTLVLTLTLLAASCWIVALSRIHRVRIDWFALLSWSLPLALFAITFFPSDTERWLFVLPAVALYLAPALRCLPCWRLAVLLSTMAAVNLGLGQAPAAFRRRPLQRARAVEQIVSSRSLVVSPGHGWDELVGLGMAREPERYPLIYHVGADGGLQRAAAQMHRRICAALAAGRPVFVVRLEDSVDPRGFKELAWFGLSRRGFAELFRRYRPGAGGAAGLWQLERPAP